MIYKKALIKCVILGVLANIYFSTIGHSQNSDSSDTSNIRKYKMTLAPLKIGSPTVSKTVVDVANQFLITLKSDSLSVTHKKKALPIHSAQQLDEYLQKNLKDIDQAQICIRNDK